MLLSPKARVTSVGFLLGWAGGIVVATTLFTLLSSLLPEGGADDAQLGALLLLLALRQWRGRPRTGEEPAMPKWMQAIDTISFGGALGLGFLLSGVNPKNLILAAGAGLALGAAGLSAGSAAGVIAIFTVIAALTVAVPVVGYLIAADRLRQPLDGLRGWLVGHNAAIMTVLLAIIGVALIGKGIGSF